MPLSDGLRLRIADAYDLSRIAELRESVGWGVHRWALDAVLEPPRARTVVAVDEYERVVGVGSGIVYGPLGFVGNMVVDADHRRRGIGAAVLQAVIEFLEGRGVVRLELYATSDGRPLYERHGFTSAGPSLVAGVPRGSLPGVAGGSVHEAASEDMPDLAAYDAPRFGGDRSTLLRRMLDDPDRPVLVARARDRIIGYGWLRPDGERLGPLVADTPDIAIGLMVEAFRRMPSAERLSLNLPAANRAGADRLAKLGAELEPWDGRMARGPQVPRRDETIYGNLVGALG
ncbi:MAG: GNAT family N-acetyltransferase [Chloroflexota bacterium]|nr:GNAT family N-acetyltransferase [Chloroflexota bacterium]